MRIDLNRVGRHDVRIFSGIVIRCAARALHDAQVAALGRAREMVREVAIIISAG